MLIYISLVPNRCLQISFGVGGPEPTRAKILADLVKTRSLYTAAETAVVDALRAGTSVLRKTSRPEDRRLTDIESHVYEVCPAPQP